MEILSGKPIAQKILANVKAEISLRNTAPGLAVLLVGNDPASHLYVGLKEKAASDAGIRFEKFLFSESTREEEIIGTIEELNRRENIHGIIVQVPLPDGLDTDAIISAIDPKKDADGFHRDNIKAFLSGGTGKIPVFPEALLELARSSGRTLDGLSGVILANSDYFGAVMRKACENEGMEMIVISPDRLQKTDDRLRNAGVIITACGIPKLLSASDITEGAMLLDGGISKVDGNVVGDVDRESVSEKAGFLSPVPGGVGPVTIACLLRKVLALSKKER